MDIQTILNKHQFPEKIKIIFENAGLKEFYPPQAEAIQAGILENQNLVMSAPTAAGKTLIAELCMLKTIISNKGRCLYIVPLKALANEKYQDFSDKYSSLGIKVGLATGDLSYRDKFLNRFQILIATAEKIDSILRSRDQNLVKTLSVVILDEIHFINDGSRGPTLEILTARIKQMNPQIQILALSATIQNATEIASWLKAQTVLSTWRPIPLKEGVYFNEVIKFHQAPSKTIKEETPEDLNKLTLDTLRGKGQVLVFVNSRRSAQAASRQISSDVARLLTPEEKRQLQLLSKAVVGTSTDSTKLCRKLAEVIRCGSAFHHAGLKPNQRQLIEEHFKKNLIKVICSTPTLAAGVNLPARRAIIRDIKRFESGLGASYIPTSEYKQCAGRAGRPQFDKFGEAVIIAKTGSETDRLMDKYIKAPPEPVMSKLGSEPALRVHILASIAGGYVHDVKEMFEFINHTFLAHQKKEANLIELISNIFDFLQEEGFIEKSGFRFFATPFGQCTSQLYVDPMSSLILRDGLRKINGGKSFSPLGILQMIACCPDHPWLNVGQAEAEKVQAFASQCEDEMVLSEEDVPPLKDLFNFLSVMKTVWMLSHWIGEEREESICDAFNIGPGDIYRHTETTQWLLYATIVFAELFEYKKLTFCLEDLRRRVHYGIQEELLDLVKIKGIGRVRARLLYQHGYKKLTDLKFASVEELSRVNQIGKSLAKDILAQMESQPTRPTHSQLLRSAKKFY